MECRIESQAKKLTMQLSGSIDQVGAEKLKAKIQHLDLSRVDDVIIDMKEVEYIGSAGVGKLLLLYKNLPSPDSTIQIVNLSDDIYEMLNDMELGTIFTLLKKIKTANYM